MSGRRGRSGSGSVAGEERQELRYDLLLDAVVVDSEGKRIGRLEEARAEDVNGEARVVEFHVGYLAALERLGSVALFNGLIRTLGGRRFYRTYVVPGDKMDFTDPRRPRATVPARELQMLHRDEGARAGPLP